MGCLKSLIKKIIFIALLIAFFVFGGYTFVKSKINDYQYPSRADFIKSETSYADFTNVPSDYQLYRSFNFFGYKKINAKYLPTNQKITVFDLKNEDRISVRDFQTKEIDKKIDDILNSMKDSIITLEDFEIIQRGNYITKNTTATIPYIRFQAKVKNVPFKNVIGTIAAYSKENEKTKKVATKLIVTIVDKKAFNPMIPAGFINGLRI